MRYQAQVRARGFNALRQFVTASVCDASRFRERECCGNPICHQKMLTEAVTLRRVISCNPLINWEVRPSHRFVTVYRKFAPENRRRRRIKGASSQNEDRG